MIEPIEIEFEAHATEDGGYTARALGYSIFTVGDSWDDLKNMVQDAVLCHFEDGEAPKVIRLTLTTHDLIAL